MAIKGNWPEWFIGSTVQIELHSQIANSDYDIYIYLPPSYFHCEKTYPVLYLTDAFHAFGICKNSCDLMIFGKDIPEIIVVGIGFKGDNTVDYVKKRVRDFTHTKSSRMLTSGRALFFYNFIGNELIPTIESEYRTDSAQRSLAGFSLGGQFAAYAMLLEPNLFNNFIIGSPTYWWDNKNIISLAKSNIDNIKNLNLTVYTFIGELDAVDSTFWKEFNEVILSNKSSEFNFKQEVFKGETHTSVFPAAFSTALKFIYSEKGSYAGTN